jgi:hypothetical protein
MSKSKTAKRKRSVQDDSSNKDTKHLTRSVKNGATNNPSLDAAEPKNLNSLISDEELEITVETLQTLAEHPAIIKSKICRDLRGAVYDFRHACTVGALNTEEDSKNLTNRISAALTDGKYTDALILLAEMRIRGEAPKLGALCRWVRDLDVVSGL